MYAWQLANEAQTAKLECKIKSIQIQSFSPPQALLPHASFLHLCQPHVMMRLYTCLIIRIPCGLWLSRSIETQLTMSLRVHHGSPSNRGWEVTANMAKHWGEHLGWIKSAVPGPTTGWPLFNWNQSFWAMFFGLMIFTKGLAYGKFHPNLVVRCMEAPLAEPVAF